MGVDWVLERGADRDMCRYPDEVTVEDIGEDAEGSGTNTPAGEPSDDFFSSWDKPAIKRPSNPPSRTGTPGLNRTASPFLSANGSNGATSRPKSPLVNTDSAATEPTAAAVPTTARAISSTAVRKTPGATTGATKPKSSILGAKKTKLGAKKVDSAALDFDEAEKKAREEAERKERLGYDPNEETPAESAIVASQPASATATIHQPTPVSPGRAGGFGATGAGAGSRQRSDSEMERLGMGVRKLGFGQVGGGAPKSSAAPARGLGFGAVGKPAPATGKLMRRMCLKYGFID